MDFKKIGPILAVAFLVATLSPSAWAEEKSYPNRPIEFIITYPPGGPTDTAVRIIQSPLQAALGVPIILTNKGGAAGALGTDFVAKAKADGYIVLATPPSSFTLAPVLNPSIAYKYTDFAAVCYFAVDYWVIACKAGSPWNTIEDVVAHAKKNPGKLTFATPGMGTVPSLMIEVFKSSHGVDIVPVHFQGTGPVKNAILGGHVDLAGAGLSNMASLINARSLHPLALISTHRVSDFPDVPTLAEKGCPEASINMWLGLFVPQKCPPFVIEKLNSEMKKIMADPTIITKLKKAGFYVDYRDSQATFKLVEEELKTLTKVVHKTGIGK